MREYSGRWLKAAVTAAVLSLLICLLPLRAQADSESDTFQYMMDVLDLPPAGACGIMANIKAESNFIPTVSGYGLCQWAGARLSRMRTWCASNGMNSTTMQGQISYLNYELRNHFPHVYSYLRNVSNNASGASLAAYYFCVHYEIPPSNPGSYASYRASLARNTYWPRFGASALYVSGSSGKSGVELKWSGGSGKSAVMRSTSRNGSYQKVATVKSGTRNYTDTAVKKKKTYYYYIAQVNSAGKELSRSNKISVTNYRNLKDTVCEVKLTRTNFTYTGKSISPKVKVTYDGKTLKKGKDYRVSYSANVNAGTGKAVITGIGAYRGTVKKTFKIAKASAKVRVTDYTFTFKKGKTFTPKVKMKKIGKGTYKLISSDSSVVKVKGKKLVIRAAGTAVIQVKITGNKNYTSDGASFTVTVKDPAQEAAAAETASSEAAGEKTSQGG